MNKVKVCKKCKRELPLNDVYFFKNKQLKDGYEGSCKECRGSSFVKRKDRPIVEDGFKFCSSCEKILPSSLEYFPSNKSRKDGLNYICKQCSNKKNRELYNPISKHNYYIANKEIILKREKQYRLDNIEKFKLKDKTYYENNKAKILEYQSRYRLENKEKLKVKRAIYNLLNRDSNIERCRKYYYQNKEILNAKCREYYQNNKDSLREKYKTYILNPRVKQQRKMNEYKRRTLKKNALSFLTKEQWTKVLNIFNNSCAYCGKESSNLTLDHFVPLSKGGELSISNVIPCCSSCNSSKNKHDFFKWYPKQEFYSKQKERKILKHLNYKDGTQQISIL